MSDPTSNRRWPCRSVLLQPEYTQREGTHSRASLTLWHARDFRSNSYFLHAYLSRICLCGSTVNHHKPDVLACLDSLPLTSHFI